MTIEKTLQEENWQVYFRQHAFCRESLEILHPFIIMSPVYSHSGWQYTAAAPVVESSSRPLFCKFTFASLENYCHLLITLHHYVILNMFECIDSAWNLHIKISTMCVTVMSIWHHHINISRVRITAISCYCQHIGHASLHWSGSTSWSILLHISPSLCLLTPQMS